MCKRFLLLIAFCCTLFFSASAQNWIWARNSVCAGDVYEQSVATDAAGNVYVAGYFTPPTVSFGSIMLTNNSTLYLSDIFLVKYDAAGNALWAKNVGATYNEYARSVRVDGSGNVYVTGGFSSPSISFGTFTLTNSSTAGTYDIFLAKYDGATGNVIWAVSAGATPGSEEGTCLATDVSGNIFLAGYFSSNSLTLGSTTLNLSGGTDIFLSKFDAAGNVLWAMRPAGPTSEAAKGLATDAAGDVYFAGSFNSATLSFNLVTLTNSAINNDAFLVKFDGAGNVMWARSAIGNNTDEAEDVATDVFGNIYVAGYFTSNTLTFGSFTITNSNGNQDMFLTKYDATGNVIWVKGAGSASTDIATGVSTDNAGNVFLVGRFGANVSGAFSLTYQGSFFDLFVVKFDPQGNLKCSSVVKNMGGVDSDIATNASGETYVAGNYEHTVIVGSDTLYFPPSSKTEMYVAKYDCPCSNLGLITSSGPLCSGSTITLTAFPYYSTSGYLWSTGDTTASIIVSPSSATVYSVVFPMATCSETLSVAIYDPPVVNSIVASDITCYGAHNGILNCAATGNSPYTYQWSPGGGTNPTTTALGSGSYTCTVTDANGCISSSAITLTQPSAVSISSSVISPVCATPGSITATATGGVGTLNYLWNPGGQTTQTITGVTAGVYTLTVTDANGCIYYQMVTVNSNDSILTAAISSTLSDCTVDNGTATVSVSGGALPYTYNWSPSGGTGISASGLAAGTYTVSATDANGCIITQTVLINTLTLPSVSAGNDTTIMIGSSAQLSASAASNYSWSPPTDLSCINCPDPVASPGESTTYCVTVSDSNGCTATDCQRVTVDENCEIFIASAFSPNGDGANDYEYVRSKCIESMYFAIFDRWGVKVFETEDQTVGWDGTYRGKTLETAVFVYTFSATLMTGEKIQKSGNISLVR